MIPYMRVVDRLEKHLFPPGTDFRWFNKKTEREIKEILDDLRVLVTEGKELGDKHQATLNRLYSFMNKTYKEYEYHIPMKNLSAKDLDNYLRSVVLWFQERYRIVNRNQSLRRLYKKYGCELLFGKKIDVQGANIELKGPAVLVSTHNTLVEPGLLTSLSKQHIFWVGDVYLGTSTTIRVHHWRGLKWFFDSLGILEVNRKDPTKGLRKLLRESMHIFEMGGIVGIFPLGSTEELSPNWDMFKHGGAIGIVDYAQKNLGMNIPLIPVGVRAEKGKFVITFGNPIAIPRGINRYKRDEYANVILDEIRKLAVATDTESN